VDELITNTHVLNIEKKGKRCYTLANLLYATVLHFYYFFITSPSLENQHKEKAAIA